MSAFECWEEQRESLRAALKDQTSVADQVYAIRHALMQTEQNTLAQQSDEVLRQQMGVLFSLVKGSVGFLETPVAATSWVAQSRKTEKQGGKAWLVVLTALLMIFSGLCCYFRGIVLGWVSALAALIAGSAALLTERRKGRKAAVHDEVRVTLQPDVERLLAVLDGQLRAIDRCANDFAYLNDSLRGREQGSSAMAERLADLMEAVYDLGGDERDDVRMHLARRYLWANYDCMDYSGGVMLIHPALAEPQSVMRGKRRAGGLLMTPTGSARCTDILPEEIPLQQEMERAIAGALCDGQRAEDVATMLRLLCKQGAPLDALEDVLQTALIVYVSDAMRTALSDLYFQTPKWVISAGSETLQ